MAKAKQQRQSRIRHIMLWLSIAVSYITLSVIFYPLGAWSGKFFGLSGVARHCGERTPKYFFSDGDLAEVLNMIEWENSLDTERIGPIKLRWNTRAVSPEAISVFKKQLNEITPFLETNFKRLTPRLHIDIVPPIEGKLGCFDLWQVKITEDYVENADLLIHELTHVFNFDTLINVGYPVSFPAWYDEGTAEYMTSLFSSSTHYRNLHLWKSPRMPAANELNQIISQQRDYLPAFSRIEFLCRWLGPDAHVRFSRRMARGELLYEAFWNEFRVPFHEFESRWRESFKAKNVFASLTPESLAEEVQAAINREDLVLAARYLSWDEAKDIPGDHLMELWARCYELAGDLARRQGDIRKAYSKYRIALRKLSRVTDNSRATELRSTLELKKLETEPEARKTKQPEFSVSPTSGADVPEKRSISLMGFLWTAPLLIFLIIADRRYQHSINLCSKMISSLTSRHALVIGSLAAVTLIQINRTIWGIGLEYGQGFVLPRDWLSPGLAAILCQWSNYLLLFAVAVVFFKPFSFPSLKIKYMLKGLLTGASLVIITAAVLAVFKALKLNPQMHLSVLQGLHGLLYAAFKSCILMAVFFKMIRSYLQKSWGNVKSGLVITLLMTLFLIGRYLDPVATISVWLLGLFILSIKEPEDLFSFGWGVLTSLFFLADSLFGGWHFGVGKVGILVPAAGISGYITGNSTGLIGSLLLVVLTAAATSARYAQLAWKKTEGLPVRFRETKPASPNPVIPVH